MNKKVCGTYVLHTCTLYMGNVCIGGAFEVSTTGIQVLYEPRNLKARTRSYYFFIACIIIILKNYYCTIQVGY